MLILPILHAQEGLVRKQEFPGKSRNSGVGFAIKNYGYLIGGRTYPGYFNDFWRYSPDSDLWVQKADFPGEARWGAFCATSGSKAYYGLGYKNTINNLIVLLKTKIIDYHFSLYCRNELIFGNNEFISNRKN